MTLTNQKKNDTPQLSEILVYRASQEEDLCILRWYLELVSSNTLAEFAAEDVHTPFAFLQMCRKPNVFLYTVAESFNIVHASIFFPFLSGACISTWTAPTLRGSRGHFIFAQKVLKAATAIWPVIIAMTKQSHLEALFEKVGFIKVGVVPYLINKQSATLFYITKETYEQTDFSKLGGNNENL